MTEVKIPAVVVASSKALHGAGGGVQICTSDYLQLLRDAGFDLQIVDFEPDQRLHVRLLRKIEGRPYRRLIPPVLAATVMKAVQERDARFVFFNLLDFPIVARALRERFGEGLKLVHLSHGLDSTDISIDEEVRRQAADTIKYDAIIAQKLGGKLLWEADYRRYIDMSICLSSLDAELERWLGVPSTKWFSHPIRERALATNPVDQRVGCVSTLDHPPNYHGLVMFFRELQARNCQNLSVRLVGGPPAQGKAIAHQFRFVEYLGPLAQDQLQDEASTWSCFAHPIFHYARGRNTKLAVALGWAIPIATTIAGTRGYIWDDGILPRSSTPEEFVKMVSLRSRIAEFERHRDQTLQTSLLQPRAEAVALEIRGFLLRAEEPPPPR